MASRLDKSGLARLAFGLRLLCYSSENIIAGLCRRLALRVDHDLREIVIGVVSDEMGVEVELSGRRTGSPGEQDPDGLL